MEGECDCCNEIGRLFYVEKTYVCGKCADEITHPEREEQRIQEALYGFDHEWR